MWTLLNNHNKTTTKNNKCGRGHSTGSNPESELMGMLIRRIKIIWPFCLRFGDVIRPSRSIFGFWSKFIVRIRVHQIIPMPSSDPITCDRFPEGTLGLPKCVWDHLFSTTVRATWIALWKDGIFNLKIQKIEIPTGSAPEWPDKGTANNFPDGPKLSPSRWAGGHGSATHDGPGEHREFMGYFGSFGQF